MTFLELIQGIKPWQGWLDAYQKYVPLFIEEAKRGNNWDEWDTELFHEFFEKRGDHCIASLRQGAFENEEQIRIKKHWYELAPLLQELAYSQDEPNFELYQKIKKIIRKHCRDNKRAVIHRLIAALQPKLLSTIVTESAMKKLFKHLHSTFPGIELPSYDSKNWFKNSHALTELFYRKSLPDRNPMELITLPWQVYLYFSEPKTSKESNDMSTYSEVEELLPLLEAKHQIILQGPPGTGKTHLAKIIARTMLANHGDKRALIDHPQCKIIQFHPSYTYEDFVRGIVVKTENNQVQYLTKNKVLADFAEKAKSAEEAAGEENAPPYILIIDEINRANLPAVLGEMIYALEYRGEPVESIYATENGATLILPKNLYIIGTMNSADRSARYLDYAIRRRFAFYKMLPQSLEKSDLGEEKAFHHPLFDAVSTLFIENYVENKQEGMNNYSPASTLNPEFDYQDVWLGHSYFIYDKTYPIEMRLEYEIKPILHEYVRDGILNHQALEIIENLSDVIAESSERDE